MNRLIVFLIAVQLCGCVSTGHDTFQDLQSDIAFENLRNVVFGDAHLAKHSYSTTLKDYLTKSDFSCQQPLYSRYFDKIHSSEKRSALCESEIPFSVVSQYGEPHTVWLYPNRVSSVHLLFASKSNRLASRFGHVALRLIVCPEGKSNAVDCDTNLKEHIVLGFRAHIDDFSLNTFKALSGEYKAYLFASRFMDVYQQYAISEFREVYSLPLRLDDSQKTLMVRELADIHWRYAGKYRFFTQNCATMLQNALRAIWPDFLNNDSVKTDYIRPDSLFETIKSSSLADGGKLNSLNEAEREGYYFSSTREFYSRALQEVRLAMERPEFTNIEDYLQISPVKRRLDRETDSQFSNRLATDKHLRDAQLMLEEYAILRGERLLQIEGAKYLEEQNFVANADSILGHLDAEHAKVFVDCLLNPIKQHTRPTKRLEGIPSKANIPVNTSQTSICASSTDKKLLHEAIDSIKNAKSEHWQQLNELSNYLFESVTNLNLLKKM
jgi:hypothetical protein